MTIRNLLSVLLLLSIAGSGKAQGSNDIDALLDRTIQMEPPYVIINLTAEDCINHKSNAFNVINAICNEKVVILANDRMMKPYLERTTDIPRAIPVIYNKALSDALAKGPYSTVCLIQKSARDIYILNSEISSHLHQIKSVIDSSCRTGAVGNENYGIDTLVKKSRSYTDSVINFGYSGYSSLLNMAYLFNYKFQTGLVVNEADGNLRYHYFDVNTKTQKVLHELFKKTHPQHDLLNIDDSTSTLSNNKILKMSGQPKVVLTAFTAEAIMFDYKVCYHRPSKEEEQKSIGITKQSMLALATQKNESFFDINKIENFYCVKDTIHVKSKIYSIETNKGFQIANHKLFIPYFEIESTGIIKKILQLI